MAIGSASIAPTAAPSASEHSSESRLRLVRGCTKKSETPSAGTPPFGPPEKWFRPSAGTVPPECPQRGVRLQVLGLGCRPSRPARLPRFSPRVLNRAEAPSPPWVPLASVQRLRRAHSAPCGAVTPPCRPDKRGRVGCTQMLLAYPLGRSVFRRGAAGLSGRTARPEPTPRSGWGTTHYMHS